MKAADSIHRPAVDESTAGYEDIYVREDRRATLTANSSPRQIVNFPFDEIGISPGVEFHPFKNMVAASFWGMDAIVVFSIDSEGCLHPVQMMADSVSMLGRPHSIVFSPLGTKMWVNNYGRNTINVYNVPLTGNVVEERPLRVFQAPPSLRTEYPHSLAMSSDGGCLACAYCDSKNRGNKLVLYRVLTEPDHIELEVASVVEGADIGWPNPKGISFTPDDLGLVVTMSSENTLMLFDIDPVSTRIDPEPLQTLRNPEARLSRPEEARFSPDGRFCAVSNSTADTLTFYEYDRKKRSFLSPNPVFSLENPEAKLHFPHGIAFSPDGRSLAVSDYGFYKDDAKWKFNDRRKGKLLIFDLDAEWK